MLGKLFKYEIKATARWFIPLYLALLLFSFINRYLNPFELAESSISVSFQTSLSVLSTFIYFALIVGIMVMTLIIMIQRFYKNLLGDEGYLMFTLPVKTWQLIVSKLLASLMWSLISFLLVMGSVLILIKANISWDQLLLSIRSTVEFFGTGNLILFPLYALIAAAYEILCIYDAIAIGHLFEKHRILASFAAYIVLYIINQIVTASVLILSFSKNFFDLSGQLMKPSPNLIQSFFFSLLGVMIVLAAGNFILTNYILTKKLNLE
ncbi:MAG: ABC transporter permease [Clostridia bacterium]|jgi:hypothetical protein